MRYYLILIGWLVFSTVAIIGIANAGSNYDFPAEDTTKEVECTRI